MKQYVAVFLKRCVRQYVRRTQPYLIGVTGSVGKTSCRMIIAQTLQLLLPDLRVATSSKNFNTEIGLPLAILGIETMPTSPLGIARMCCIAFGRGIFGGSRADIQVLEYGIDGPGDMERLLGIATPHVSFFTALDLVHAHQLMSRDMILAEKSKLLLAAKEIVFYPIHLADEMRSYIQQISVDTLSYAISDEQNDAADSGWTDRGVVLHDDTPHARFLLRQGSEELRPVITNLLGKEEAGYIAVSIELAMIVARRFAVRLAEERLQDVLEYQLQPGRYTVFSGKWGSVLIDSSYNAAPKSMHAVLHNAVALRSALYPSFDLVCVLGEMRELGAFTEEAHRALAHEIAPIADEIYLVGESMRLYCMDELKNIGFTAHRVHRFASSQELGTCLAEELQHREHRSVVVFKGSQNTIFMEEAVKPLLKHADDIALLARHDAQRMKKKQEYFSSVA